VTRRLALVLLVLGVLAAPPGAGGQTAPRVFRVGILAVPVRPTPADRTSAAARLPLALRELGYVEGQDLHVEQRWAGGQHQRLAGLARELVQLRMDVIVAIGNEAIQAAMDATKTIPIVMLGGSVVARGFVASLAQPGGNVTGVAITETSLADKRLELLKEAVPAATRIAVLTVPADFNETQLRDAEKAAGSLGVTLVVVQVRDADYERAFTRMVAERAQALLVLASPILNRDRARIIELAARHRLPAIYQWREHAEEGGLMAYGSSAETLLRRMAAYVDRILKGARPADLPVEQPTVYELIVNLKTARALGLTLPQTLLFRADQVIQ
jgi:putative ABC transport system substrate-binding protein